MNPVVGFNPDPMSRSPSAGEYSFADGTTLYGDDPELYSQVGGMSGGDGGGGQGEIPNYYEQPAPAPEPPPGSPYAAPPDPVTAGVQAYAEGMPEAKQYDAEQQAEKERRAREDFQRTHKYVPGRAGVTGEQLQAQAASGVEIPVATTTQVSPGLQDTPEDAEARAEQSIEERLTAQNRADFESAKLGNTIAHLDKDTQRVQQEVGYRKILQESAAIQADKQMAVLDQTAKAYKEHKIDPKQIFGGSTFAEIGAILAQAGGAYAAILGGGQNYAQQIIDNAIDRNIAVQRLEHEQLGEAADNAYSRFLQMTGDAKQAEDMLRATQNRLVGVERERFAAESGREEVAVALGEWETQHAAKRLAEETAIRERAIGKIVQSTQSQVAFPRSAQGGGYVPKTEKEIRKDAVDESNDLTTLATNKAKRAEADTAVSEASGGGKVKTDPLYVEGYGQAASKGEASAIRGEMANYNAYRSNLQEVKKLIADKGSLVPGSAKAARLEVLRDDIVMQLARRGGGIVTDSDRSGAERVVGSGGVAAYLNEAIQGGQTARLDSLLDLSENMLRERIGAIVQGQHPDLPKSGATE